MQSPVILITGASAGIGAATALLAAQRGYQVAFTYLQNAKAAQQLVADLQQLGVKALPLQADVSIEADVLRVFDQLDNVFGHIDVLVNNAGILRKKLFLDFEVAELEKLFGVNVVGSFICAREAGKRMAKSRGGSGGVIVNVSSIASRIGSPFEYIDYAATKGAIDSFTLGLAKEWADEGIRVNAVRPGIIATDIHAKGGEPGRINRLSSLIPLQRAGTANEVAEAILWLASPAASYVTASLLDIGGGR